MLRKTGLRIKTPSMVIYIEENILFTDFIETMTGDTYTEQLVKTKELGQEEHNYFGLLAFGEIDTINPITRKLSLYK